MESGSRNISLKGDSLTQLYCLSFGDNVTQKVRLTMQFASRLDNVETSAIRELFKLLGKPGIISFAGGFPDSAMFDVEGLQGGEPPRRSPKNPAARCNTAPPRATSRCAPSCSAFMKTKGVDVDPAA